MKEGTFTLDRVVFKKVTFKLRYKRIQVRSQGQRKQQMKRPSSGLARVWQKAKVIRM